MKANRLTLIAGFMPALCMAVMLIFEKLAYRDGAVSAFVIVLLQILPFLLPSVAIALIGKFTNRNVLPSFKVGRRRSVAMVIMLSLTATLLSFLINCVIAAMGKNSYYRAVNYSSEIEGSPFFLIIAVVVLPAIFEELFFRGFLMKALSGGGELAAIIISALCFAMCHGSISNFAGPFAAGLIYGYMVYALDSLWPAVFAHLVNNALNMAVGYATKAYETLGLWPYFIIIAVALFCIFLAISMTCMEKLVLKGKIRRLNSPNSKSEFLETICSPGLWILVIVFIIRVCYN
jgi:membrane protease YdiL (CAAX protease family)